MNTTTAQAARRLLRQRLSLTPITALPIGLAPISVTAGYALQRELNHQLVDAGMGEMVGHKIGCTTPVMQAFLDINQPCAGRIFSQTVMHRHGRVPHHCFVRMGVECEIAVRLQRDLPPRDRPYSRQELMPAVAEVMAAIELVDERYLDYRTLGVATLIADDFFNAGCVLGEPLRDWSTLDLSDLAGRMQINGAEVGTGRGELVMGHPLNALAWLANAQHEHGLPGLKAGEFVMLGSVVETKWLKAGDRVRIAIDRLGEVALDIED
jgi:2-oxo-3-hexenedioate decarboxylase/2-keto-4-pentenoate hydratase